MLARPLFMLRWRPAGLCAHPLARCEQDGCVIPQERRAAAADVAGAGGTAQVGGAHCLYARSRALYVFATTCSRHGPWRACRAAGCFAVLELQHDRPLATPVGCCMRKRLALDRFVLEVVPVGAEPLHVHPVP